MKFRTLKTARPLSNLTQRLSVHLNSGAAILSVQSKLMEHVGSQNTRDIYAIS